MSTTMVKDFIKVEGVNTKVSEKLPEAFRNTLAGSVKTATGWYNVRKGLDMNNFVKDGTYEVELEISERGAKTIVGMPSFTGSGIEASNTETTSSTASPTKTTFTASRSTGYDKGGNGAEAGGIYHDAVALAAAISVAGLNENEAVGLVDRLAEKLLAGKRRLQEKVFVG